MDTAIVSSGNTCELAPMNQRMEPLPDDPRLTSDGFEGEDFRDHRICRVRIVRERQRARAEKPQHGSCTSSFAAASSY